MLFGNQGSARGKRGRGAACVLIKRCFASRSIFDPDASNSQTGRSPFFKRSSAWKRQTHARGPAHLSHTRGGVAGLERSGAPSYDGTSPRGSQKRVKGCTQRAGGTQGLRTLDREWQRCGRGVGIAGVERRQPANPPKTQYITPQYIVAIHQLVQDWRTKYKKPKQSKAKQSEEKKQKANKQASKFKPRQAKTTKKGNQTKMASNHNNI